MTLPPFDRRAFVRGLGALTIASVAGWPASGLAQRVSTLSRILRESRDFRARANAALALGVGGDTAARPALERALGDSHHAVRAAAATALGRLGDAAAVPALRRAARDRSPDVRSAAARSLATLSSGTRSGASRDRSSEPIRWGSVRAAVVVGDMRDRSGFRATPMAPALERTIVSELGGRRELAVFRSSSELDGRPAREIARRRLPTMRLDGHVQQVRAQTRGEQVSIRCEVSLMLLDERTRDLRGMLRGAATASERTRSGGSTQQRRLAQQALEAAVRTALRSLESNIAAASRR